MEQTAYRTRLASRKTSVAAAGISRRANTLLFQAFSRLSCLKTTDRLCIKDTTTIDPAVESGNFLTETYLSIWRLEKEIINTIERGQLTVSAVALQYRGLSALERIWSFHH